MTRTKTRMKGITIEGRCGTLLARPTSLHAAAVAMLRMKDVWPDPKVWVNGARPTVEHLFLLPENMRHWIE